MRTKTCFRDLRRAVCAMLGLFAAVSASPASSAEPGWRPYTVPQSASNPEAIQVALFYPTDAPARDTKMGPFTLHVAVMAPPAAKVKGLIIVSHGTGGSETAHSSLAEGLAVDGYLVASLRHPGDNWQDKSLWNRPPGDFFVERPRQVSRVIDAVLADGDWKDRIGQDSGGPRIGVLGHSAGGFTAIALAGGQADMSRIAAHCRTEAADDPLFCSMARLDAAAAVPPSIPATADKRVRAVMALAPLGVVFTAPSLAAVAIPTAVYAAEKDRWLVPRFHADWIAKNIPKVQARTVAGAWHFAFLDRPDTPIMTLDGDAAADSPDFDRAAFLARLRGEVASFFDRALAEP
jgi:predicted dienelactone hydrolase